MNCNPIFLFSIFFLVIPIALAETTGNISLENLTIPPVTGLLGYTVQYCNSTAECGSYYCFVDYDGTSAGASSGWCYPSSSNCLHDGTWITTFCDGSTLRTCSSGSWSSTVCAYGCENATCKSASTAGATNGGDDDTETASITIVSSPSDFNITQNESTIKSLKVKNNGDLTLSDITLELSGIDFYSITPTKIDSIDVDTEDTFSINFAIPANATVKEYTVTATVTASSASASTSFKIKVLPSEETVEADIIPLYQECLLIIEELENDITRLEGKGINTTDIRALFDDIKDKLNQTNSSLENKDYYTANQLLNSANAQIEDLKNMIATVAGPEESNLIIILVIVIIIIIGAVVAYLFLPVKSGFRYKEIVKPVYRHKEEDMEIKSLLKKIKEKKNYGSKK